MHTSANDIVLRAIQKRENLETEKISVKRLLQAEGTEKWAELCCDRIAENDLLVGNNVAINFADFPDIELTSTGVLQCREMLLAYVTEDLLKNTYELLCAHEDLTRGVNEYACMLRGVKNVVLFKTYLELGRKEYADTAGRIRRHILEEIWSRSVFMQVWRKAYAAFIRLCTRIMYYKLIAADKKLREAEYNAE